MNSRAVSNTVATILLVAIMVALVALVTVFVFNISDNGTTDQPTLMNTDLDYGPSDHSTVRLLDDSNPGYIAIRSPLGTKYNVTSGVGQTEDILRIIGEDKISVLAGPDESSATVIKQYEVENGISVDIIVDKLKRGEQGVDWDYASIQAGVDNATEGDTVVVRRADYDENINVNKNVTIVAEPNTIIKDLNPERAVFDVTGDNATIRNFDVNADPRPGDGHYSENGFYIAGNDVAVRNNRIINATEIANSASVNITGESARIVGNTLDRSNNGITSNNHSDTHIIRRNNMLGINNFDIKNLDSKGLNARNNYWKDGENVYGVVDTTRELDTPVNNPIGGQPTKGIGGNGRIVYSEGRLYIMNGAGATDLYKMSITLEVGDGTVTIQPVSSNSFKIVDSSNINPNYVFNDTKLSQSDSTVESSSSNDDNTFNSGESISFNINQSYSPPTSDGGSTSISDSFGSTTVRSSSSDGNGGSSSGPSRESMFISGDTTTLGSSGDSTDDSTDSSSLDSISSVDDSPDWSIATGDSTRTIPVSTEVEFTTAIIGLSDSNLQSIEWSMGDGTTLNGQSVNHTYSSTGKYDAIVTVIAMDGKQVSSGITVDVTDSNVVDNYEPVGRVSILSDSVYNGIETDFSASSSVDYDGTITSYEWDFDDDGSYEKTGETASYTFSEIADKNVGLRVTDTNGATDSVSKTVEVASPDPYFGCKKFTSDTTLSAGTYNHECLVIENGVTVTAKGNTSLDGPNSYGGVKFDTTGDILINGTLDATRQGWGQSGPGTGGASYGAYGGRGYSNRGTFYDGGRYGSADEANRLGSGSQNGKGGGSVWLQSSSGKVTVNGDINAYGESWASGGSIRIEGNEVYGDANLDANGGTRGGGGRVLINGSSEGNYNFNIDVSADAGTAGTIVHQPLISGIDAGLEIGSVGYDTKFQPDVSSVRGASISSYHWDFDDGSTSTVKNPSHTYDSTGTYNIRLTVTNEYGLSSTYTKEFVVEETGSCAVYSSDTTLESGTYEFPCVTVEEGVTLTMKGDPSSDGPDSYGGVKFDTTGDILINGTLDATRQGWGQSGPGTEGASYGAYGGRGYSNRGTFYDGGRYGSADEANRLGSGSQNGKGGGSVWLQSSSGKVTVNGDINAYGESWASGGSIRIEGNEVYGDANLDANGGSRGGGGRVLIIGSAERNYNFNIDVSADAGTAGTVVRQDQ